MSTGSKAKTGLFAIMSGQVTDQVTTGLVYDKEMLDLHCKLSCPLVD